MKTEVKIACRFLKAGVEIDSFMSAHKALKGLPCGSDGKESAHSAGDPGSIPGLGRSPGEGNGILAWRVPWAEEPGGLQSVGLQGVRHD